MSENLEPSPHDEPAGQHGKSSLVAGAGASRLQPGMGIAGAADRLQAASNWLQMGVPVLPVQPNSKHLVKGFGPYRSKITTQAGALRWFGSGRYNLALAVPNNLLALDFDDQVLFFRWQDQIPVELCQTYHEISPRGFHVFFWLWEPLPVGLVLVPGVEVKNVILSAPSVLPGFNYQAIDPSALIIATKWEELLSPLLSEPPKRNQAPAAGCGQRSPIAGDGDLVSRIKAAVPVLSLASRLTELKTSDHGRGRWYVGKCPFHDDQNPSFWVDVQRGLWGCRAGCGRGDVINLWAKYRGISIQAALVELAGELRG